MEFLEDTWDFVKDTWPALLVLATVCAGWGLVGYVVVHFILKYW